MLNKTLFDREMAKKRQIFKRTGMVCDAKQEMCSHIMFVLLTTTKLNVAIQMVEINLAAFQLHNFKKNKEKLLVSFINFTIAKLTSYLFC
jgi:hypothetical protein